MTSNAPISDELLSAYLDNAVTAEERALVEDAVARNPDVAWRLASLRYTVALLSQLPELHVPRTFTLRESQVAAWGESPDAAVFAPDASAAAVAERRPAPTNTSWWARVRAVWQTGNPVWRNAAAACATLLLVLLVGGELLTPVTVGPTNAARQSAADVAAQGSATAAKLSGSAAEATADDAIAATTGMPAAAGPTTDIAAAGQAELYAAEAPTGDTPADATPDSNALLARTAVEEESGEEAVIAAGESAARVREVPQPGEDQAAFAAAAVDEALVVTSADAGVASGALGSPGSEDDVGELFAGAPPPPGVAAPMAAAPLAAMPSQAVSLTASGDTTRATTARAADSPSPIATPTSTPAPVAVLAPAPTEPAVTATAGNASAAMTTEDAQAIDTATDTVTPTTSPPLDWRQMSRLGLAGLTVLFAGLWLVSRRTRPTA